ncbi:MAG: TolC family outer membrane protein [Rhodocyclaceae bacterium]|nr:TolC family outer membrane protein [Rhodocyclaceae bacterium]
MNTKSIVSLSLALAFPALCLAGLPNEKVARSEKSAEFAALKTIVQSAILNSPEVLSKWHNYKAADEEIGVARGAFLPRIDASLGAGKESLEQPPLNEKNDYNRNGYVLSLNQMIFDGFATRNEVRRLDKARLVRYYELLDASENVALEASKAYLDVLRYRFLNNLAEDNYVQHKATYEQLLRRTQSGVGRRVDLEQAGSRLALAEVNLTTENANLHDVTARYMRLVNSQPPNIIFPPALVGEKHPNTQAEAIEVLLKKNPALLAAVENIEASQYDIDVRRAAYSPKLDFRARTDNTSNYQGVSGDRVNNVAELVVTWNLFNGGSDRAREKQYIERKNISLDLREKACRDTRQTLAIAYNDVARLRQQAGFVNSQVSQLEKTRDAYRDQYDVGQRTLLDLLDTENELLSARRSAVNVDMDLILAYLRTHAGMGTLLEFMGLEKLDTEKPDQNELAQVDAAQLCAPDAVRVTAMDRELLDTRAMEMLDKSKPGLASVGAPAAPIAAAPIAAGAEADVMEQVGAWAAAWTAKDYSNYINFYAPSFTPDGGISREDWFQLRRSRIAGRNTINVDVQDLTVRQDGDDRAFAEFRQFYRSDVYHDTTQKTLEMIKVNGKWLINRESSVPCVGGGCTGGAK